jgi:ribonuclease HI
VTNDLSIYCDGGARGNPGPAASAFVVFDAEGKIVFQQGDYLNSTTNNLAEYRAVFNAVQWLGKNFPQGSVNFYLDSQLVVNQLKGLFKIKEPGLIKLHQEIQTAISEYKLPKFSFKYVPREKNFMADKLVNETLDAQLMR